MGSQFGFLQAEWPSAFDAATRVEAAVKADPRAACVYARQALETIVRWIFDTDGDFKRPYDRSLAALLAAPTFKQFVPPAIVAKTQVLRDLGNRAAHATRPVPPGDGLSAVKELFHVAYWFARQYSRNWTSEGATFDPAKLPAAPADAAKQTLAQLQKLQADL
jgi:type I restriction enzyme R subunit